MVMPATKEKPKKSNVLYVFVENKKYSLAYSNDLVDLKSTMGMGKKSFFFYFAGKSKNETQSTIILIAREMSKEGRRPRIKVFTDGSITPSMSDKLITEWNKLITADTKAIPTDKVAAKTARKEILK
jgi:hypothetical protein